jgi:2-phosphoglycerate kinase
MTEQSHRGPESLILIGGPAGAGKSRLAHALAGLTASTVAQIDDMQTAIESLVPSERLPEYFVPSTTYLRTDSPDEINGAIEQIAAFFAPAVLGAISNRIESGTSTVFEGDFISPEVAAQTSALGVSSLFLLASEDEIRANFLARDGDEQRGRARVSATRSLRLAVRCRELGLATVNARPFDTLLSRACGALGIAPSALG